MPFHAIAILSGNRQKTIPNRSEQEILSETVNRIYETNDRWDKREGPLGDLIKRKRNQFPRFEAKAQQLLGKNKARIFVVMLSRVRSLGIKINNEFIESTTSDFRRSKPTRISSSGSAESETLIVSPIPDHSSMPMPIDDFTVPEIMPPASVMPRWSG